MNASCTESVTSVVPEPSDGYTGLGIGLTIVHSLTEMHGGTVEVASDGENQGSKFTLCMPIDSEHEDAQVEAPKQTETGPGAGGIGRRVLVVDDNKDAAQLLGTSVKMLGGDVRIAYDGEEAIVAAEELVLTGWGQDKDKRRTLEAGFNHHLVKPCRPGDTSGTAGLVRLPDKASMNDRVSSGESPAWSQSRHAHRAQARMVKIGLVLARNSPGGVWYQFRFLNYGVQSIDPGVAKAIADDYQESLRLNYGESSYYCSRAFLRSVQGNFGEAIADCDTGIRLDRMSEELWAQRGYAHFMAGETEKAAEDIEKCLKINPRNLHALLIRGRIHLDSNRQALAAKDFNSAVALAPRNTDVIGHRAAMRLTVWGQVFPSSIFC